MIFKHLLPRARSWRITIDKTLKQFFEGLTVALIDDIKTILDEVFQDINPAETTKLDTYENQFGLPATDLTIADRRTRLDAAWKSTGGQSPRYIQDTLQDNGFNVYVHEWWVPGTEPAVNVKSCVAARNAATILVSPKYPLVNIVLETTPDYIVLAGEAIAQAGEADAQAGNYIDFKDERRTYITPLNTDYHHYFLYIGGSSFGTLASIDANRRDEFEALCLKICPCHLWLGMLVQYV
jgi:hypothetical protein